MSTSVADNKSFTVFKHTGGSQFYCRWTEEEDRLLSKAVADHGPHKWTLISHFVPGRTAVQCSTRWFGALNPNIHKGRWIQQEDQALIKAVNYFQSINPGEQLPWNKIAEYIPHRTGIQCQARWSEALNPEVRKGRWHIDEDKLLNEAIARYGCCWIRVASMIPTRTQRQCRTRYNQIRSQQIKGSSRSFSRPEKGFLVGDELISPVKRSSKSHESIIVPSSYVPGVDVQQSFLSSSLLPLSDPSPPTSAMSAPLAIPPTSALSPPVVRSSLPIVQSTSPVVESSSSVSPTINSSYVASHASPPLRFFSNTKYQASSLEGLVMPKEGGNLLFPSTLTFDNTTAISIPTHIVDDRHPVPYSLLANDLGLLVGYM